LSGDWQRHHLEPVRAIGAYVVYFSQLVLLMRGLVIRKLSPPEGPRTLAELALGEASAIQIANAFFAICQEVGNLDETELRIGRSLRSQVLVVIERRNDIAHGDWWTGGLEPDMTISPSRLIRIKPARADGTRVEQSLTVADLDQESRDLINLQFAVIEFGNAALGFDPDRRVSDLFELDKKRAVRRARL